MEDKFNKKKIEDFYEVYRNKILDTNGEKIVEEFKESINKLKDVEIRIARLEKFDKMNAEIKSNYESYIESSKKLLEEKESKLTKENYRNVIFLKYFLAIKMAFFCRKYEKFEDEIYFNNYVNNLKLDGLLEETKNGKREYLFQDEVLSGLSKKSGKSKSGFVLKFFKWFGFSIALVGTFVGVYYISKSRKRAIFNFEIFKHK